MTRIQRILLSALVLNSAQALAAEIAGVKVDERISLGASELVLNGAGMRTKAFFKVYVAGLYLAEKRTSVAEVLALPGAKRVSMRLMRDLNARQLTEALDEGIRDNTAEAELEVLKGRLAELTDIMNALQSAKEGDVIALDWLPGSGTRVVLNGEARGKAIAGGLTTIEEKALGNIQKIGRECLVDGVLDKAEVPTGPGLWFMDSSSAAAEMVTLCAASGYAVHFFPTGQCNVIGNPILPVIKICANPRTVRTMSEHVDVDVSGLLRREMSPDDAGDKLLECMFRTANGRLTAAEALGHREFVLTRLYESA